MKKVLIIILSSFVFLFTACDSSSSIDAKSLAKTKIEAEKKEFEPTSFVLLTTDEKFIGFKTSKDGLDFDEFKGKKAVIVDIFATWCPPCIEGLPTLIELKDKYKDDFEIVSVLFEQDKPKEEVLEFIKKFGINYPITMGDDNFVLAKELGDIKKVPEMFLFSKSGKFIHKFVGNVPKEELEKYLKIAMEN